MTLYLMISQVGGFSLSGFLPVWVSETFPSSGLILRYRRWGDILSRKLEQIPPVKKDRWIQKMFGLIKKTLMAVLVGVGLVAATTFNAVQMTSLTRSTVNCLNSFQVIPQGCISSGVVSTMPVIVSGLCSAADSINYFQVAQEPLQVASLFKSSSAMLTKLSQAISTCDVNLIITLLENKALELSNWSGQLSSGAPVSLSQTSIANGLKSMASNLEMSLISSAGFDLCELIQYDL